MDAGLAAIPAKAGTRVVEVDGRSVHGSRVKAGMTEQAEE
jgi:hypothetical protein